MKPLVILALAAGIVLAGPGRAAEPMAPPGAPAGAFPQPDRPVAEIISPAWASEAERDAVDEAGQVARLLRIGPGTIVADLGAGSGFHTVRLARAVGPAGRVYAEDVVAEYLSALEARVAREKLGNVTVVAGEPHDPRLAADTVDVAILIHMYHEIAQPFGLLHNLVPALRRGGRVGIVDLDRRTEDHGTPPRLLRCELEASGFRQVGFHTLSGRLGYLAIFEPPEPDRRPDPGTIAPCASGRRR